MTKLKSLIGVSGVLSLFASGCFLEPSIRDVASASSVAAVDTTMKIVVPTRISQINTQTDDLVMGAITVGGKIYFFENKGSGSKLFSYDGTTLTQRSDISQGSEHNWLGGFNLVNGKITFDAFDSDGRLKFYSLDPTTNNVVTKPDFIINNTKTGNILSKQVPFTGVGAPALDQQGDDLPYAGIYNPVFMGGAYYFVAFDGTKYEVYQYTPGTPPTVISNIGRTSDLTYVSAPFILGVVGGVTLSFAQKDVNGLLQTYHYTVGDALPVMVPVANDYVAASSSVTIGGSVYAPGAAGAASLYDTTGGIQTQDSNTSGGSDDQVSNIVNANGDLYFGAVDGSGNQGIYSYHPTDPPTTTPTDVCGAVCTNPTLPIGFGHGLLYFQATDTDGNMKNFSMTPGDNTTTTVALGDQLLAVSSGIRIGNVIYFAGKSGSASSLYSYTADAANPVKVSNTSTNTSDLVSDIVNIGGNVYFSAVDSSGNRGIYEYIPGGAVATAAIANVCGATCTDGIRPIGLIGGKFYFNGTELVTGNIKIYKTSLGDNTTTVQAFVGNANFGDDAPMNLTEVSGSLYFTAFRGTTFQTVNGANHPAQTVTRSGNGNFGYVKVYRYTPGIDLAPVVISNTVNNVTSDDAPYGLVSSNGSLFWIANDASGNQRLFKYTLGGAVVASADAVSNTSAGANDTVTGLYTGIDGNVYFTANDNTGTPQSYTYANAVVQSGDALAPGAAPAALPIGQKIEPGIESAPGWYIPGTDRVVPYSISVAANARLQFQNFAVNVLDFFSLPSAWARPVEYLKIAGGGVQYVKIRANGGGVQYVKINAMFGAGSGTYVRNGTTSPDGLLAGVYTPGEDRSGIISPGSDFMPNIPFRDLGGGMTEFGNDHRTMIMYHDPDHLVTYFRDGLVRAQRSFPRSKIYEYKNSHISAEIRVSAGADDISSSVVKVGNKMYFTINDCGGMASMNASSWLDCTHLYEYTP